MVLFAPPFNDRARGSLLAVLLLLSFVLGGCAEKAASTPAAYPQQPAGYPAGGVPAEPSRTVESVKTAAADPAPPAPAREVSDTFAHKRSDGPARIAQANAQTAPPPPPPGQQPPTPTPKADPTQQAARDRELIIYTARVTMAVYQVDQGVAAVEKIAHESGGYLATKQDRGITIRVPRARFQDTLSKVDKIGDVLHRDVQAQDVTDEHLDLEIRIKNARAMRTRLQDLLSKANVKEALEIEKELHRITEELERLEGKLKLLADKVAYSTITVAFEPRGTQIRAASVRLPFPWLGQVGLPGLLQLSEEK